MDTCRLCKAIRQGVCQENLTSEKEVKCEEGECEGEEARDGVPAYWMHSSVHQMPFAGPEFNELSINGTYAHVLRHNYCGSHNSSGNSSRNSSRSWRRTQSNCDSWRHPRRKLALSEPTRTYDSQFYTSTTATAHSAKANKRKRVLYR